MKYSISAGHEETLNAAKEILLAGGNAVDAAIAAYWMSFLSEPCMASAGAGGFAMVSVPDEGISMVDFFCQTPNNKRKESLLDFYPVTIDFGPTTEDFYVGLGAMATPGAISGMYAMHKKWGSIPMKTLTEQAISKAKNGIALNTFQAMDLDLLKDIFGINKRGKEIFFNEQTPKEEGEKIQMPFFADFLECLTKEGSDLFYRGEIAQQIVADCNDQGGALSMVDMENYQTIFRKPLTFEWNDLQVDTTGYPSSGGAILAAILKSFESQIPNDIRLNSQEHFNVLLEVNQRLHVLKDNDQALGEYLKEHFEIILENRNTNTNTTGTSHFNIVDKNGMAVALTTSIGEGCGYFIEGTDMQMNNMLGEAALLPNGFHSWEENTRLRSMMTPTIISQKDQVSFVTGTGGAGRIPFMLAQTIINALFFDLPLEKAIDAPKLYFDGQELNAEIGFDHRFNDSLEFKEWEDKSLYFGGTHSIKVKDSRKEAVGDRRRYGVGEQC